MKRLTRNLLWALCALSAAPAAFAQGQSYLAATIGQADAEYAVGSESGSESDDTLGFSFGYLLNENFGFEAGLQRPYNGKVNVVGVNLGIIGIAQIDRRFDLYGKYGFYWWAGEASADLARLGTDSSGVADNEDNDDYLGFGAKYRFHRNFDIGLEYVRYDLSSSLFKRRFDIKSNVLNAILFIYYH